MTHERFIFSWVFGPLPTRGSLPLPGNPWFLVLRLWEPRGAQFVIFLPSLSSPTPSFSPCLMTVTAPTWYIHLLVPSPTLKPGLLHQIPVGNSRFYSGAILYMKFRPWIKSWHSFPRTFSALQGHQQSCSLQGDGPLCLTRPPIARLSGSFGCPSRESHHLAFCQEDDVTQRLVNRATYVHRQFTLAQKILQKSSQICIWPIKKF